VRLCWPGYIYCINRWMADQRHKRSSSLRAFLPMPQRVHVTRAHFGSCYQSYAMTLACLRYTHVFSSHYQMILPLACEEHIKLYKVRYA